MSHVGMFIATAYEACPFTALRRGPTPDCIQSLTARAQLLGELPETVALSRLLEGVREYLRLWGRPGVHPPTTDDPSEWIAFFDNLQIDRVEKALTSKGKRLFLFEQACLPIASALDPLDLEALTYHLGRAFGEGFAVSAWHPVAEYLLTGEWNDDP